VTSMLAKMQMSSRTEAAVYAARHLDVPGTGSAQV